MTSGENLKVKVNSSDIQGRPLAKWILRELHFPQDRDQQVVIVLLDYYQNSSGRTITRLTHIPGWVQILFFYTLLPQTQENKKKMARNGTFFSARKPSCAKIWWYSRLNYFRSELGAWDINVQLNWAHQIRKSQFLWFSSFLQSGTIVRPGVPRRPVPLGNCFLNQTQRRFSWRRIRYISKPVSDTYRNRFGYVSDFSKCERCRENWGPVSWCWQILWGHQHWEQHGIWPLLSASLRPPLPVVATRSGGFVSRGVPVRRPRDGTPPTSHKKTTTPDPSFPGTARTCSKMPCSGSPKRVLSKRVVFDKRLASVWRAIAKTKTILTNVWRADDERVASACRKLPVTKLPVSGFPTCFYRRIKTLRTCPNAPLRLTHVHERIFAVPPCAVPPFRLFRRRVQSQGNSSGRALKFCLEFAESERNCQRWEFALLYRN